MTDLADEYLKWRASDEVSLDGPGTPGVAQPAQPTKTLAEQYEEWSARERQRATERASIALEQAQPADQALDALERAERARELGREIPADLLTDPNSELVRRVEIQTQRAQLANSTGLSGWLTQDPLNASLARGNVAELSALEGMLTTVARTADNTTVGAFRNFNAMRAETALDYFRRTRADRERTFGGIVDEVRAEMDVEDFDANIGFTVAKTYAKALSRFISSRSTMDDERAKEVDALLENAYEEALRLRAENSERVSRTYGSTRAVAATREAVRLAGEEDTLLGQASALASVIAADPSGFAFFMADVTIESLPSLAAAAVVGRVTGNRAAAAGTAGIFSAEQGSRTTYEKFVAEAGYDLTDPEQRAAFIADPMFRRNIRDRAFAYGAVVGIFDAASGGLAGQQLAKSPLGDLALQAMAQAVMGSSGEALAQVASGQELNMVDILIEGLAEFTTAPVEIASVGGRMIGQQRRVREDQAFFEALATASEDSEVRKKAPKKYQELVATLTADGPVETLYVDAQAMDQLFQSDPEGMTAEQFLATVTNVDLDAYRQALDNGGVFEIPTASYAAEIVGSRFDPIVREHLRTSPERMSAAESVEYRQQLAALTKLAEDAAERAESGQTELERASMDAYSELVSRLRRAGRAQDVAEKEALQAVAMSRTVAARRGITLDQQLEEYPLARVQGVTPLANRPRVTDAVVARLRDVATPDETGVTEAVREAVADAGLDLETAEPAEIEAALTEAYGPDTSAALLNQTDGRVGGRVGQQLYQSGASPLFFSALTRDVENAKQKSATAKDWIAIINKLPGVKKAEIDWSGVIPWLQSKEGQLPREEVAAFLRDSEVVVEPVVGDEDASDGEEPITVGGPSVYEEDLGRIAEDWWEMSGDGIVENMLNDAAAERTEQLADEFEEAFPGSETDLESAVRSVLEDLYNDRSLDDSDPETAWLADRVSVPDDLEDNAREQAAEQALEDYQQDPHYEYIVEIETDDGPRSEYIIEYNYGSVEWDGTSYASVDEAVEAIREHYHDDLPRPGVRWEEYTEGGGEDYREIKLTVPNLHNVGPNQQFQVGAFVNNAHYDTPNIVTTARVKTRKDAQGRRVLFVEEAQSDLASRWRKEGGYVPYDMERDAQARKAAQDARDEYRAAAADAHDLEVYLGNVIQRRADEEGINLFAGPRSLLSDVVTQQLSIPGAEYRATYEWAQRVLVETEIATHYAEYKKERARKDAAHDEWGRATRAAEAEEFRRPPSVPVTPFEGEAHVALITRHLLQMAAREGADVLAWTPAYMQARRWSGKVQNVVNRIVWEVGAEGAPEGPLAEIAGEVPAGVKAVTIVGVNGTDVFEIDADGVILRKIKAYGPIPANEVVGKNISELVGGTMARSILDDREGEFAGENIVIGGDGFVNVYDRQMKKFVEKFAKKYGGKLTIDKTMPDFDNEAVWSVTITDKMREAAREAQPLFQSRRDGVRGAILLPPKTGEAPLISLFETADLSTFLHESGHYYLHILQDLVRRGELPPEMQQDWDTVNRWWAENIADVAKDGGVTERDVRAYLRRGTTNDPEIDRKVNVGLQEQWARAYEAYLMEGKAPSSALRAAFESFSAWLLDVYRRARGLDSNINDELRGVFDRMLATDEEIAAATQDAGYDTLISQTAEQLGIEESEYQNLVRLSREAQEEAKRTLLKSVMAPIRRAQKEAYRAEREEVRAEMAKRVNGRPANRVREWLGNGRWLGDGAPEELPEDLKLDRQMLVDEYGEEGVKKLPRGSQAIYKEGTGISTDDIAGWFGYSSGDAMIQDLVNAPKAADEIKAMTEAEMRKRYADDPLVDATVAEEAAAAVRGEKRGQLIAAELRAIGKTGRKGKVTTRSQAAEIARRTIRQMPIFKAVRSGTYRMAERRAAEKATIAVANGDMEAAYEAKREQLIQHHLYMESRKADEILSKIEKRVASLKKKSIRAKLAGEYLEAIDQILVSYDFRKSTTLRAAGRRDGLLRYVEMMREAGRENELAIPEHVLDEAKRRPYKTLPVNQIEGVLDSLRNIEHTARMKKKLRDAKETRDFEAVRDAVVAEIDANVKDRKVNRVATSADKRRAGFREYMNLLLNTDTILRKLGGFEMGEAYQAIKTPIDVAASWASEQRIKSAEAFEDLYSVYTRKEQRQMARRKHHAALDGDYTKWDLISIALNMGNAENLNRLMDKDSNGFTSAQIDYVKDQLDERDWKFVQASWDYINTFWPMIEERERRTKGTTPKKVMPSEVVTKYGTFPGGYYPIKYRSDTHGIVAAEEIADVQQNMLAGRFAKAQTRSGHLEERALGSGGRTLYIGIEVMHQHVGQVIHDLAFSEPVNNAARLLKALRPTLERKGLLQDFDALEMWLQDTATGQIVAGGSFARLAVRAKSGFTLSKLAFNLSTVMVQLTGISQSMVVVGSKNMALGYGTFFSNPSRAVADVLAVSQFMRTRETTFNRDINDVLADITEGPPTGRFKRFMSTWGFWLMQKVQFYAVDVPTWHGGYRAGLEKFDGDEQKARHYADRMVARAQASGVFSDRSAFERGTLDRNTRQNGFVLLFTTLGSYMFAKGNIAYEVAARTRRDMTGANVQTMVAAIKGATDMAMLFTLEAIAYNLIKGTLPGMTEGEDDEQGWAEFLAKQTALSMMGTVPGVRDAGSALAGFEAGAYSSVINSLVTSPLRQMAQGEADLALFKSLSNAAGIITGLPSGQLNRTVDAWYRLEQGDDVAPIEFIMGANR